MASGRPATDQVPLRLLIWAGAVGSLADDELLAQFLRKGEVAGATLGVRTLASRGDPGPGLSEGEAVQPGQAGGQPRPVGRSLGGGVCLYRPVSAVKRPVAPVPPTVAAADMRLKPTVPKPDPRPPTVLG